MKKVLVVCLCLVFILCGCGNKKSIDGLISYMDAKEMIINDGAVLVDVRTIEEYDEKHIGGALSLPLDNITEESVGEVISSKETEVIVYCKSGKRSAEAKKKLESIGYTNVYDLGSMSNWKE